MPRYQYACLVCHEPEERVVPVDLRDEQDCVSCGLPLARKLSTPHAAPIGGIPNRLNRNWNEG